MSRAARFGQQVCHQYMQKGSCRYGENCRYLHQAPQAAGSSDYMQPGCLEAQLHEREWSTRQGLGNPRQSGHGLCKFRLMSYNILADELAHKHKHELYPFVDISNLEWTKRLQLILSEVAIWNPDVICFQEVDHYDHLLAALSSKGYEGQYAQRGGGRTDGCATFWRGSKFRAYATHTINFNPLGLKDNVALVVVLAPTAETLLSPPAADTLAARLTQEPMLQASDSDSGVTQACNNSLQKGKRRRDAVSPKPTMDAENPKAGKQPCSSDESMDETELCRSKSDPGIQATSGIADGAMRDVEDRSGVGGGGCAGAEAAKKPLVLVGNIHVLFNPKRGDVKLGQLKVLTSRMKEMATALSGPTTEVVSLVGGDFNSTPHSGLYRFMKEGNLDLRMVDRKTLSGLRAGGRGYTSPPPPARNAFPPLSVSPQLSPNSGAGSSPALSPFNPAPAANWANVVAGGREAHRPSQRPPPMFSGPPANTPTLGGTGGHVRPPSNPLTSAGTPPLSHPTDVSFIDLTDSANDQNASKSSAPSQAPPAVPQSAWWRNGAQGLGSPMFNSPLAWFSKPTHPPPPPPPTQPPPSIPPPPPFQIPPQTPPPQFLPSASNTPSANPVHSVKSASSTPPPHNNPVGAASLPSAPSEPSSNTMAASASMDDMSIVYSPTRDVEDDSVKLPPARPTDDSIGSPSPSPFVWEPGAITPSRGTSDQGSGQEYMAGQHGSTPAWGPGATSAVSVTMSNNSWQTTMLSPSPAAYMSSKMKQVDVWVQRGLVSHPTAEAFKQQVRVMWERSWSVHDVATALGKFSLNIQPPNTQLAAPATSTTPSHHHTSASSVQPVNAMPAIAVQDEVQMMHLPVAINELHLQSAYAAACNGQEPPFTTSHHQAVETVDYVWFTPHGVDLQLTPSRVLLPPSRAAFQCGMPNQNWPSDHVSLVVDFTVDKARHRDWWPAAEGH